MLMYDHETAKNGQKRSGTLDMLNMINDPKRLQNYASKTKESLK
jgi:hypothetical protein